MTPRGLLLLPAFAIALALAACAPRAAVQTCDPGHKCLHIGNSAEPLSMDPNIITSVQDDNVVSDMIMGLTQMAADGTTLPGMAESWTSSPNGLVWTFKLRDAKWSDGTPVTAGDFVYGMRRLQDPKTAAEYAYLAYILKNAKEINNGAMPPEALGARAIDDKTLELTLTHPAPFLLELAGHQTFYPLPQHVVEKWGEHWTDPEHMVANGPYKLAYWRLGDRVKLVKNPLFYEASQVCADEVYYYATNDAVAAERRVLRGELDMNDDVQSSRLAYLRKTDPQYLHTATWMGTVYLSFNTNLAKFKDVRVRQALSMAVDRDFIVEKLFRGSNSPPAYSFVAPGTANYPGPALPYWATWPLNKRQDKAKKLLAAAGYTLAHPLSLTITQRNTTDPMLFMPAIQADWAAVGVKVALNPLESQIAYDSYRVRNFEVADGGWIADYNDAASFLNQMRGDTGEMNYSDYKSPQFDALMDASNQELDLKKRGLDMQQAEAVLMNDMPIVPIYFYISKNLVRPNITGFTTNITDRHRKRWMCKP